LNLIVLTGQEKPEWGIEMRYFGSRLIIVILIVTLFVTSSMIYPQSKNTGNYEVEENEGFSEPNPITTWPTRAGEIWPMHLNNPQHTSYTTAFGPSTNEVLWDNSTGGITYSSPCIADGNVFIGADEAMNCYYENNGTLAWRTYTIQPVTGTFMQITAP
jgi:outer membrane protein assembly factor BamB